MTKRLPGMLILCMLPIIFVSCVVGSTLLFSERDIDDTQNLVLNNSFAAYSEIPAQALKNWSVHLDPAESQSSHVVIDPQEFLDGKTSLRIDASEQSVMILSEPFKVRRYGGYYLRSYFKTNSQIPPQVQLRFIVFKENGKIINRFKHKSRPGADWQRSTISAGFIKPGARFGRLAIFIPPFKDGSIWIDNAGCFEVHGFKID